MPTPEPDDALATALSLLKAGWQVLPLNRRTGCSLEPVES